MKQFFTYIFSIAAAALLCTACSDDDSNTTIDKSLPEGYGRLTLTITTPEATTTRATTGNWLDGTEEERAIKSYHILVCEGTAIVDDIKGDALNLTENDPNNYWESGFTAQSKALPVGTHNYTFYALVNFTPTMLGQAGLTLTDAGKINNATLPTDPTDPTDPTYFETKAIQVANSSTVAGIGGKDGGIPMTGKLGPVSVVINPREITEYATPIVVWRMIAKLEFTFTNETTVPVRILGIEVDPINQASEAGKGIFLLSKDDLNSTVNDVSSTGTNRVPDKTDVGPYKYEFGDPLQLNAKPTEGTSSGIVSLYVNETDATYTVTPNEYSVRIKTQRATKAEPSADDWFDSEIRYGITQSYSGNVPANPGDKGFSVIRRNDWIKIPVTITDYRVRIEVLAFVPIGGYPALDYLDELNAIFSTGGWIVVKPIVEKYTLSGIESYGLTSNFIKTTANVPLSGDNLGDWLECTTNTIFDTAPEFQSDGTIIAELSNTPTKKGKATFTLKLKLGDYTYQFKFNVTNKQTNLGG